jgi:hypothetical protein
MWVATCRPRAVDEIVGAVEEVVGRVVGLYGGTAPVAAAVDRIGGWLHYKRFDRQYPTMNATHHRGRGRTCASDAFGQKD